MTANDEFVWRCRRCSTLLAQGSRPEQCPACEGKTHHARGIFERLGTLTFE